MSTKKRDPVDEPREENRPLPALVAHSNEEREALEMFERGNYAVARERAQALEKSADADARAFGSELASRMTIDGRALQTAFGALIFFGLVVTWALLFHTH